MTLLIGQGIAGTWLSYYLDACGEELTVMDDGRISTPSRVAGGLINPVTGRRYSVTWLASEIIPFAHQAYMELGARIGRPVIRQADIIDFFSSPQMRVNFLERAQESNEFLSSCMEKEFQEFFHTPFGCGRVSPAYIVDIEALLDGWRKKLEQKNGIISDSFQPGLLEINKEFIAYGGRRYDRVIFCNGNESFSYPWFRNLPYAASKGESVLVKIQGLPAGFVFKHGMLLLPTAEPALYWMGSSYEWDFTTEGPTRAFREKVSRLLDGFLKLPYQVVDHRAAIRPSTLERRPFVGFHPANPRIGMLNGLGTKGCSLAPYFAHQLVQKMKGSGGIHPLADIARFEKILSRDFS